jgi:hypothetical protein
VLRSVAYHGKSPLASTDVQGSQFLSTKEREKCEFTNEGFQEGAMKHLHSTSNLCS